MTNGEKRYYRARFACGKRLLGRCIDYLTLRAVLFLALYLFFRSRVQVAGIPLLLAGIALLAAALLLRVARETRFARFRRREERRIREALMQEKLMLLPADAFRLLTAGIAGQFIRAVPLQRAEPIGADDVLAALKGASPTEKTAIFATAGFSKGAETFARGYRDRVTLVPVARLTEAVAKSPLAPSEEDVAAYIARALAFEKRKKRVRAPHPLPGAAQKYGVTALLLTGASFLTGYALYYRLLAGVCMLFAAGAFLLSQRAHENAA